MLEVEEETQLFLNEHYQHCIKYILATNLNLNCFTTSVLQCRKLQRAEVVVAKIPIKSISLPLSMIIIHFQLLFGLPLFISVQVTSAGIAHATLLLLHIIYVHCYDDYQLCTHKLMYIYLVLIKYK